MTGRLVSAAEHRGKTLVTFEIDGVADSASWQGCELRLDVRRARQTRSVSANAYFYVLCQKLSERLRTSLCEVHNLMLARYGVPDTDLGTVIMRDDVDWLKLDTIHLAPTSAARVLDDGRLYRVYRVIRGSHTYDTAEMSRLIDGVISEATEQGIETATPDEIERMKSLWKGERK